MWGILIAGGVFLMSLFVVVPGLFSSDPAYQSMCFWYTVCIVGAAAGWGLSRYAGSPAGGRSFGQAASFVSSISALVLIVSMSVGMWMMFVVLVNAP